ncbi:unnamed protein product (macronuclear) [Paramecium tetraurelia]|uniref:PIPK domain-containing protein n=1 Tax=Paramecium tetraurelia TaxID=5888 RepID=A0D9N1_PARTE|nr:uncharacterized protein GSPATT00014678001 [Paramecium tetraurelia]CAK79748.1 unnamed protein product [Paramecium tetraurelia]|eukprot:XP_001447145.1 hypothetical protein (macronuclear) [Paramecium tetraurelia strain d4-2]
MGTCIQIVNFMIANRMSIPMRIESQYLSYSQLTYGFSQYYVSNESKIPAPITFFGTMKIVYQFLKDTKLFGVPGDSVFVIMIMNGIESIVQFSTAIYVLKYNEAPLKNAFCEVRTEIKQITGLAISIVFVISNLNIFVYAAYPLALIYNTLKSAARLLRIFNYSIVCIIILVVIFGHNIVSLTLNGICAISATDSETMDFVISLSYLVIFLLFGTMSVIYVLTLKKLIPKYSTIRRVRGQYLRHYQRFIGFSLIMKFLLGIFSAINLLNCYKFQQTWLEVSATLQNITQALCILGQTIMIFNDSSLKLIFNHSSTTDDNNENDMKEISLQCIRIYDFYRIQCSGIVAQRDEENPRVQILRRNKLEDVVQYKDLVIQEEQDGSGSNSSQGDLSELMDAFSQPFTLDEIEECLVTNLNNQILQEKLKINHEIQVFSMRCILYAPKIFNYFITLDNIDVEDCFDLMKNSACIDQFTGPDGGKSGEFFFFSYNNQLIIKTMRQSEVNTYKKRLYNFATYQFNNHQSLLNKIYGMYTFEREEQVHSRVHFLIMKNISLGIPRNSILRTYDMKGSEYDREVLAKKPSSDLSKITLKDLDFFKIEQEIWVEDSISKKLNQSLQADSNFLERQQLIDYSLLVMIIDWNQKEEELQKYLDGQQINVIPSIKEKGIYYHIAIIDYLQRWNVNKSLERKTKKIIKMNMQLDTSAQEPNIYGKRFQEKLINRIVPLK